MLTLTDLAYAEELVYSGDESTLKDDPAANNSGAKSVLPDLASASNNNVSIIAGPSGSTYTKPSRVYGGYSNNALVSNNAVNVQGGTMGQVFGGYSESGVVSDNRVNISGGTMIYGPSGNIAYRQVYGGYSVAGDVTGNNVTVTGGTFLAENSLSTASIIGGGSNTGKTIGNSVDFSSGTISGSVTGGESSNNDAAENRVTITGGNVRFVYGGNSSKAVATKNIVNINGGTVRFAFGGITADNSDASYNTVNMTAGTVSATIYGGQSPNATAYGNAVNITGGSINGNVVGGSTGTGQAINNSVTLSGENMTISGSLYGGFAYNTSASDVFTGNTLNLEGYRGSVSGIYNFENYNWVLPKDVVNGDVMITITGSDAVDLTGTKQTIAMVNDGNVLNIGDKVTLIDKAHGYGTQDVTVNQGFFLSYNMEVSDNTNALVLTVKQQKEVDPTPPDPEPEPGPTPEPEPGPNPNPQPNPTPEPVVPTEPTDPVKVNPTSKAFLEGRAAALAFVNQGGELIAIHGGNTARAALANAGPDDLRLGFVPFVIANGSSSRYKTGSHVDVDGFNSVIGLAAGGEVGQGHQLTLGAFFEFGRGNYDSYNSFGSYGSVHGDGDTNYTGGGVLFRMDIAGTGLGRVANLPKDVSDGLYVEGSFRGGKVDMDFDSSDLIDGEGYRGRYDSKVTYLGAHGAVGYVFNFDAKQSLDVYGRYMWTKMDGDTVLIGKDKLHFGSSESSRIRVGARYSYQMNEQVKPYVGLAYEHEFKGDIAARAYDLKLDKPSLKGDTGVLELGVSFKPVKDKPLSIDVAAEGYAGQRQGGGGLLKLKYQF